MFAPLKTEGKNFPRSQMYFFSGVLWEIMPSKIDTNLPTCIHIVFISSLDHSECSHVPNISC